MSFDGHHEVHVSHSQHRHCTEMVALSSREESSCLYWMCL